MNRWTWRTNPQRFKACPICGGKARHFSVPDEAPTLGYCWTPPSSAPLGWKETSNPNLFINQDGVETAEHPVIPSKPPQELAPPTLRDALYRELLKRLSLSGSHKRAMQNRGFTHEQLVDIPFASLLSGPRTGIVERIAFLYQDNIFSGVPGFYINDSGNWTCAGRSGLLIPIQDAHGHIIALQIRPDYLNPTAAKDLPKYVWLSSKDRNGGSSPGAPAGVLFPDGSNKDTVFEKIYFTEGFFKALAIREFFNAPVVWIAGVSGWRSALEPFNMLKTHEIVAAFDADFRENAHVQAALLQSILLLGQTLQKPTCAVQWDSALGKGIDDAILRGGLQEHQLKPLDIDQLLTGLTPPGLSPNNKYLRITEETTEIPEPKETTQEQRFAVTEQAIHTSLTLPIGTISLIDAGTGCGKSTALAKHVPENSLIITNNYDDSGQQVKMLLESQGKKGEWCYGRQRPIEQLPKDAPPTQRERSQIANCKDFRRAVAASSSGHNACKGCPFFPQEIEEPDGTLSTWYSCGYRRHRDQLRHTPPYGLAIPEVGLQPDILDRYETIVFDDIASLLYRLADERRLSIDDIATWQGNALGDMPLAVQSFFSILREEMAKCALAAQPASATLRKHARYAKKALADIKESPLPCEQPYQDNNQIVYPKVWVRELVEALANKLPAELTASQLIFWSGSPQILSILKKKRVIILDATPDHLLWKGLFGSSPDFWLHHPELPKVTPRIVQVPDIHGTPAQIQRLAPYIDQLAERENAFILTRAGECSEQLNADGWMGRHERALNTLQHFDAGIIAGHFGLPPQEAKRIAEGMRALACRLNIPDPEPPAIERDEEGRAWRNYYDSSGRYAGLQRYCAINEDPLAEHISRHFHTSAILQGWGRHRAYKILYLIDGCPLYSPESPIGVTIMTLRELGLEPPETRGNPQLKTINAARSAAFEQRVQRGVEALTSEVLFTQEIPGISRLRTELGEDGRRATERCAKRVQSALRDILEKDVEKQQLARMDKDIPLNSDKSLTTLRGSPPDHSCNNLEYLDNHSLPAQKKMTLPAVPQPASQSHMEMTSQTASKQVLDSGQQQELDRGG